MQTDQEVIWSYVVGFFYKINAGYTVYMYVADLI